MNIKDNIGKQNNIIIILSCAWLCSVSLIELNKKTLIDKETFQNSKIIKEIINLLIESHYNLTTIQNSNTNDKSLAKKLRIKYFINLISLIRLLGNKESEYILKMQEEVSCRKKF